MSDSKTQRILIADDQPDVLEALRLLLKGEGYKIETVTSPADVLPALEATDFDLLLMDLNYARDTTSGQEGLDLLSRIQAADITLPVVVMTAWGSVEVAVEAMRRGARDFIQKPWDNARLLSILRTQIELGQALRRGQRLEAENQLLRDGDTRPTLIAQSRAMQPVLELIAHVGPSDANVLITGEHGTGKEVVAQTLHSISARASKPLVTVDAGSLSEGVFESELFGHVKGAFTDAKADRVGRFELADGSTLFLDEVGELPLQMQVKLLHFLEQGRFRRVGSTKDQSADVRIIAATNRNLVQDVRDGRFRADLYYRLNVVALHVSPLRERPEDIGALIDHFLDLYRQRFKRPELALSADARQRLESYSWPGNVRELRNCLERAAALSATDIIEADQVLQMVQGEQPLTLGPTDRHATLNQTPRHAPLTLHELERQHILRVLAEADGNRERAAAILGISARTLYRKIREYEN